MHMTENMYIQPQQQTSASYTHDREQRHTATTTDICCYTHDREQRHTATTTASSSYAHDKQQ